ncbi:DUF6318 family protein [Nesterenkonia aurantiaca]|uniref:DUF6318 domain-containing protein n=1 Tax=Nesterenkonia aurantiaca TaxID=1436010 RepID=A0A4V3EC58_9MICC|nr:DUF6318 family protein [Nesterenkonia aurantiaca]TDS84302.1 hypothetical protein EV640_108162 [Nesterenkonia aurantiaca]
MNTSAGRLGVVSLVLFLGCLLSSCGGNDAGPELGGSNAEPSTEETSPEGGASEPEQPGRDGDETEDPEPSPTPVPASSDGPAQNWPEPEIPAEIYEETEEGALAALEYWFEAITYLQLTGDFEPAAAVSAPDCEMCDDTIAQFYDLYEVESGWYVAAGATAQEELVSGITEDGHASILFALVEGGYTWADPVF